MNPQCAKCGGKCCKYFCFEIDEPEDVDEFEDVRWYLCHEGVSVHIDEGDWYICIENRCRFLRPDARCEIYDDRPLICRKYDPENCDYTQGSYDYDEEFRTPEAMERYARKVLGDEVFERKRRRARQRLDRKMAAKAKTSGKRGDTQRRAGKGKRTSQKAARSGQKRARGSRGVPKGRRSATGGGKGKAGSRAAGKGQGGTAAAGSRRRAAGRTRSGKRRGGSDGRQA